MGAENVRKTKSKNKDAQEIVKGHDMVGKSLENK